MNMRYRRVVCAHAYRARSIAAVMLFAAITGCAASGATTGSDSPATAAKAPLEELEFKDVFKLPVGPYGLEPSNKLLELQGRRVHMRGYVVDSEDPTPGVFLLTPQPVALAEKDDGPADDLPGNVVFVHLPPTLASVIVPVRPDPVDVIGVLELGRVEEASGRVSYVRLRAEPPVAERESKLARTISLGTRR